MNKVKNNYKNDIVCVVCIILFYILFIHIEYAAINTINKPWAYSGDSLGVYLNIANMADSGNTTENSRLAAPFKGEF
jgi:uncharacterized membrane protein